MSRSNDPAHFFQTTSALNETARKASKSRNTKGNPIKLPSKILAVTGDPQDEGCFYVAEAAGNVKRVNLETGEATTTFSGPTAPLTSIAVSPKSDTIYAGCWDKSIWSWKISAGKASRRLQGHSDFVKAVTVFTLQDREILVSGSSDATIIVWDADKGEKLHTLTGHTRGILALALDATEYGPSLDSAIIFSAGTDREIRRWSIGILASSEVTDKPSPIIAHETSVNALRFDSDGDLWTASADRTAKCLSRNRQWDEDSRFEHPDYVRDVAVDEDGGWVVTACRDEEVRVWDKASGKLHHVFSGHFEEVTALLLLSGQRLVSVSIDGTARGWSLKAPDLAKAVQEAEDERAGKEKDEEPPKEGLMTADEEAELAALMEDSD